MDHASARKLIALNTTFYQQHAASFSATRQAPWTGWNRMLPLLHNRFGDEPETLSVLDLACGNMRLASYLHGCFPHTDITYHATDNCDVFDTQAPHELPRCSVQFQKLDILSTLLGQPEGEPQCITSAPCELVCSFGFLHHVPTFELRAEVLRLLLAHLAPHGIAVVSFWQFMNDARLAGKARSVTAQAHIAHHDIADILEENDWLLGWQDDPTALRYCHHTNDEEIDRLLHAAGARELTRFSADGASGTLNRYVVLERP